MNFDKLLVVGLGSIGAKHAQVVRSLWPDIELAGLRHTKHKKFQTTLVDKVFYDMADAIAFAPSAAVICSPAPFHLDSARCFVDAGIPLLIEKPIASDAQIDEVITFSQSCTKKQSTVLIGYNLRYMTSLVHFRESVATAVMGKVSHVLIKVGHNLVRWRPGRDYRDTVSARQSLGGGVLLELSHELDYLRWIFGQVRWVRGKVEKKSNLEIDVEDTVNLEAAVWVQGHDTEIPVMIEMDIIRDQPVRQCTVVGEAATIRWDGVTDSVLCKGQGEQKWLKRFQGQGGISGTYRSQWKHFQACIRHSVQPQVSVNDGLIVLRIIEAARRSSARGEKVWMCGDH